MNLLEARHLSKVYRAGTASEVRAVQDVDLDLAKGSFTLLTGASGSGKSTLLSLLGALERPTQGQVVFAGKGLHDCSDAELARTRRRIGFVFQQFALIPGLPVWENITYSLIPRGVTRAERSRRADELLTRLGLGGKRLARPAELSGGEQQRVAIARALVGTPELLLADEPTSNLDEASGQEVIGILRKIHSEGVTIVVASHDARLAAGAGRVCEMRDGRLIALS